MRNYFAHMAILVLAVTLGGCRAKREMKASEWHGQSSQLEVQLRKTDSVSLSEHFFSNITIDFFPPDSALLGLQPAQAGSAGTVTLGAVRRVTVETRQNTAVTHVAADTVSERLRHVESDSKSVETSSSKPSALPVAVGIAALMVAVCSFILYNRRK